MKRILITGATRGIGYATARRILARNTAHDGADGGRLQVLALGRDFTAFDLDGDACMRVDFDLRATEDIAALCERLGPVDVLVNNAAMLTALPFEQYTTKDRRDLLATNIEAPGELIRCLVPAMIARHAAAAVRGRVVNVASVAGFGGHPDVWYGASKGAILNLTKSLARRYGPEGVLINAVAPGPTRTAMFDRLPQSRIDEFNRLVFAGRFAEPDEIARVIEWLALDAPEYVNGACIDATSGGYLR